MKIYGYTAVVYAIEGKEKNIFGRKNKNKLLYIIPAGTRFSNQIIDDDSVARNQAVSDKIVKKSAIMKRFARGKTFDHDNLEDLSERIADEYKSILHTNKKYSVFLMDTKNAGKYIKNVYLTF